MLSPAFFNEIDNLFIFQPSLFESKDVFLPGTSSQNLRQHMDVIKGRMLEQYAKHYRKRVPMSEI